MGRVRRPGAPAGRGADERTDAIESGLSERIRALRAVVAWPLGLSTLALLLAGVFPLRLDLRTFQTQARLEPLGLPRGADFLVLTRDNTVASAELAQFALAHWSFPRGARHWLTLAESSTGPWSGGFTGVDAGGGFLRPATRERGFVFEPQPRPDWLDAAVRGAAVVYDSAVTRALFEARLPELRRAARVFVADGARPDPVPLGRARGLLTPGRVLRLSALIGTLAAAVALLRRGVGCEALQAARALATAAGLGLGLSSVIAVTYVCGELRPGLGTVAPFALWLLGAAAVARFAPQVRPAAAAPRSPWSVALMVAGTLYAGVAVLRLDFDGDTYTTYIPVARYLYLLGHHDPLDPGIGALVQGSVYPPGFAVLLTLPLWVMGQPREASFALGAETSAVVLLYRLAVVMLDLAFLAALGAFLRSRPRGTPHLALAGVLGALGLAPVLRGAHTAAETLLVPLAGLAVVTLAAGRRAGLTALAATGVFLGATLTLVKLDGLPALLLLVVPVWLGTRDARSSSQTAWRRDVPLVAALIAGLVPFVVWRLTGPVSNASFAGAAPAQALARLPALGAEAFKLLVKHELWVALCVLLPAALAAHVARRAPWRELLVPLGIATQCAAWVSVYAFSTLGAASHMELSLPRIMLAPALAALIWALAGAAEPAPVEAQA